MPLVQRNDKDFRTPNEFIPYLSLLYKVILTQSLLLHSIYDDLLNRNLVLVYNKRREKRPRQYQWYFILATRLETKYPNK